MDFEADWMLAKRLFETATGRKKPSAKFLGAFRKSSGLESACKELDQAIAQPSVDGIAKAEKKFAKAAEDYIKVLRKAASDDDATETYKAEVAKLEKTLEKIRLDFTKAKREEVHDMPMAFGDIIPDNVVNGLANSPFPTQAAIKNFATKSEFGVSGVDGRTKLPAAATAQKQAQDKLKLYVNAMKAMKTQVKVVMERKAAWKKAGELYADAGAAVGPMEGFQGPLADWTHAQENAFKAANRQDEFRTWLTTGPLSAQIKLVADACTAELVRLSDLEDMCQKQSG